MKLQILPWIIILVILSPIVLGIQNYFVYSDAPFLTPQYGSVVVKHIMIKYFNYSQEDDIYVLISGNYTQALKEVNSSMKYLNNAKLITPYEYLNQSNQTYFKMVSPIINSTYKRLLPLHSLYVNLTREKEFILNNFTVFLYELNVTYGIPAHKFYPIGSPAQKFVSVYSSLNGSTLEKARNASLEVFKDPFVLLFSFNNYSNSSLVLYTIKAFNDYSYLVRALTGVNVSNFALEDPYNYSVLQVEKEIKPMPVSLSDFHKNGKWLFIIQVPNNESLTRIEDFMKNINATVTGHLPIYAESAIATEKDLKIIDVVTVILLSILLILLVRALIPIVILILSAIIGLEIAYTMLFITTFFGYQIYYISGLVIPPIVFGITVDYSILFLYRYFEEVRKGNQNPLSRSFRTAGKALVFSGLSITLGFSSFIISPSPLLKNIGIALVIASVSSLVPALFFIRSALATIPQRLLRFPRKELPNPYDIRQKYLEAMSRSAIKWKYAILGVMLILGIFGFAVFHTHTTNVNINEIVPSTSEVVVGEQQLTNFLNYSVDYIIIKGNPNSSYSQIYNLSKFIIDNNGLVYGPASIGSTLIKNETYLTNAYYSHNYTLIEAYIPYPVFSKGAIQLTKQLIDMGYLVGGSNAQRIYIVDNTVSVYYSFVLPLTIVLITIYLGIVLGSVVVPLRLSLTLLLSSLVGIAFMFIIFTQVYWLSPLIVFAIMYSLGIDYDMFIIIRILEENGEEEERIVKAVKNTGLVVTAAGLILAGAFMSLGSADMRFLQEIGISVGLTILFDTFIVRPIFVPAIMAVLKKYNWWPRIRVVEKSIVDESKK
ncbi:MMPL family transporter [Stygiolobus caldivivus]|uniref:Antibiotic transporter n=1 Tax=Stygiolobus caldivivus TaxID=2824673 RepID=A0A8D5ZDJ4_9CREN|nr:MMPL family transporter [Stygiolobus caldivivus]BCU69148.1 antibiotic transporter [Stygiolobus caldivivus]